MNLPKLFYTSKRTSGIVKTKTRDMVMGFKGYNHNVFISDEYMFDMTNLSGDLYPLLSLRKRRGIMHSDYKANCGIFYSDACYYVNTTVEKVEDEDVYTSKLYRNGTELEANLNGEMTMRQFAQIGAYLVIFPDKVIFDTYNDVFIPMDADISVSTPAVSLCTREGNNISFTASASAPASPQDGAYWIDTSVTPNVLKRYSSVQSTWNLVPTTYVKISATGIGDGLKNEDAVSFSGFETYPELNTEENAYKIVYGVSADSIVTTGIISVVGSDAGTISIRRTAPAMDYICAANNRIWGCSSQNHEIYACKLGDPTNWRCYQGITSDSYAATIGSPGDFTGCVHYGNYILFSKENVIHKLYGTKPANYTITETNCSGIAKGSYKSAVTVGSYLYYLSNDGVMRYNGSVPVTADGIFGEKRYHNGVAGVIDNKYYLSMIDNENGEHNMFVFDASKGVWYREDLIKVSDFSRGNAELYFTDEDGFIYSVKGSIKLFDDSNDGVLEDFPYWSCDSGDIGLATADHKYLNKIVIRMALDYPNTFRAYVSYDDKEWKEIENILPKGSLDSYYIPIKPIRCDHFKIRLTGEGNFKLYSISKVLEQGSELK